MYGTWEKNDFYCVLYNEKHAPEPYSMIKPWCFIGHFDSLTKTWSHFAIPHLDSFFSFYSFVTVVISDGIMNIIEPENFDTDKRILRSFRAPIK
jgi:hypothetical protein